MEGSKKRISILSYDSDTMPQIGKHYGLAYSHDDIDASSTCDETGMNARETHDLVAQTPSAVGETSSSEFSKIPGTSILLPLRRGHGCFGYNESTATTRNTQVLTSVTPLKETEDVRNLRQSSIESHKHFSTNTVPTGVATALEQQLRTSKLKEANVTAEPEPLSVSREKYEALVEDCPYKIDLTPSAPFASSQQRPSIMVPVETPQRVQDWEKESIEPALPFGEAIPQTLRDVSNKGTEAGREMKEDNVQFDKDLDSSGKRMAEVIKIKATTASHHRSRDERNDCGEIASEHAARGQSFEPPCLFLSNPHATSGPQPASRSKRVRFSETCVAIGSGTLDPVELSEGQRNGVTTRYHRRYQLSGSELPSGAQGLSHHFAYRGDTNQVPHVSSIERLSDVEASRGEKVTKSSNSPSPSRTHICSGLITAKGKTLTGLYSATEKANVARKRKYIADLTDDDNGGEGPDLNRSKHALPSRRPRPSVQIGMPQTRAAEVAAAEYDGDIESEDGRANLSDDAFEHEPGNGL